MKHKFYYCHDLLLRNSLLGKSYPESLNYNLFSIRFCEYFSEMFEKIFMVDTGISPSLKVNITSPKRPGSPPLYEPGEISRLNPVLWIQPYYHDDISFCWRSKSGKLVQPWDEEFDEDDLECWMEGLKPAEYWKQIATPQKSHPFQISGLHYELVVFEFGTDTLLRIYTKPDSDYDEITHIISTTVEQYNTKSESAQRKDGVIHNFRVEQEVDALHASIDTGSAGVRAIKKILKALNKLPTIIRVEVDV